MVGWRWWLLVVLLTGLAPSGAVADDGVRSWIVGDPADVSPPTTGGLALIGGGRDLDAAFEWLIDHAGGGDIVVLRVSGDDGYNAYIRGFGRVDSVETIAVRSRAGASAERVVRSVRDAEAIFVAGGDQWDYLRLWDGTPLAAAISQGVADDVPFAGTSAGLAIMGEVVYSAENGTVTSREALRNPYDRRVRFERAVLALPLLADTVTDSHFGERRRLGRLVAFVARLQEDRLAAPARGIGVDEETALLVEADGRAEVRGKGAVVFLRATRRPEVCDRGDPLTARGLTLYRADAGDAFDLPSWRGEGGQATTIAAIKGRLKR